MSKARSLNKVMLIGNLTRNPVLRETTTGSLVCTFGVATNSSWRDSSGNVQERTEFHNIVAWNKLAEICAQILSVGMLVYIEGEIRSRSWEDQDGNKKQQVEVKLLDMCLLDSKGKKGVGIDDAKNSGAKTDDSVVSDESVPVDESDDIDTAGLTGEDLF